MITVVSPDGVPPPPGNWYSHALRVEVGGGALIFVSGQAAYDAAGEVVAPGDMGAQSERVFALLAEVLADQGAGFDDVVSIRTHVTDISQLAAYGAVRARYLRGRPPTSTTVEVSRLFRPGAVVEVDLVAAVGG